MAIVVENSIDRREEASGRQNSKYAVVRRDLFWVKFGLNSAQDGKGLRKGGSAMILGAQHLLRGRTKSLS